MKSYSDVKQCILTDNLRGCILTDNLGDNEDVRKSLRGVYARANILIRRFSHCSKDVKLVLFKRFVPISTAHSYGGITRKIRCAKRE